MGENVKGLQIQIDANFSALSKSIKNSRQMFKTLENQVKDIKQAMKFNPNFKGKEQEFTLLKKALEESKAHAERLKEAFDKMKDTHHAKELTQEFTHLQLEIQRTDNDIRYLEHSLKNFNNSSTSVTNNVKGLGASLKTVAGSFKEVYAQSKSLGKMNEQIGVMGIALGNLVANGIQRTLHGIKELGVTSVRSGVQFEEAIANLKALYGNDLSQQELDKIIAKTKELGTTTVYNATEVAQAMRSMALAGYNSKQTIESIESALNLASASGEEFSVVSNILVDGLKAFGYETDQAERFANALGLTAVVTNADVADLGESFKYVGAVAGTFKYSIEDISVALGAMASNGIKGSTAGTSLRQMLLRLATDSKAQGAFEKIGGQFYDATGKARPLINVLEDLRKGLANVNDEEKAYILNKIAGQRAVTGLSAIVSLSEENWKNLNKELQNTNGAVKSIAEKRLDNLNGDIKLVKNSLEDVRLTLFDKLQPTLRDIAQEFNRTIKSMSFKQAVNDIGKFTSGTLKNLNKTLQFVVKNIDLIVFSIRTLIPTITFTSIWLKFSQWFLSFAKAVGVAKGTIIAFQTAVLPIAGWIAGVTLAITGVIAVAKLWETQHRKNNQALYESAERLKESREQYASFREEMQKNIQNIANEHQSSELLIKELDRYVDKNGKVKEGYETRVNYILNELKSAYGIEIEMINGAIKGYDELKAKLQEISKQKLINNLLEESDKQFVEGSRLYKQGVEERAKHLDSFMKIVEPKLQEIERLGANHKLFQDRDMNFDEEKFNRYINMTKEQKSEFVALNGELSTTERKIAENYFQSTKMMEDGLQAMGQADIQTKAVLKNVNGTREQILSAFSTTIIDMTGKTTEELEKELQRLETQFNINADNINGMVGERSKAQLEANQDMIAQQINAIKTQLGIFNEELTNQETKPIKADKFILDEDITSVQTKATTMVEKIKEPIIRETPVLEQISRTFSGKLPDEMKKVEPKGGESANNFANTAIANILAKVPEMESAGSALGGALARGFNSSLEIRSPSRKAIRSTGFFIQGITQTVEQSIPKVTSIVEGLGNSMAGALSTFKENSNIGINAIQKIESSIDVGSSVIKALENANLVPSVTVEIDGREISSRVSMRQGLELKRGY